MLMSIFLVAYVAEIFYRASIDKRVAQAMEHISYWCDWDGDPLTHTYEACKFLIERGYPLPEHLEKNRERYINA